MNGGKAAECVRGSAGSKARSLWLETEPPYWENYTLFFQNQAGALAARDPDKPRLELCLRAWVGLRTAPRRAGIPGKGVRWGGEGNSMTKGMKEE